MNFIFILTKNMIFSPDIASGHLIDRWLVAQYMCLIIVTGGVFDFGMFPKMAKKGLQIGSSHLLFLARKSFRTTVGYHKTIVMEIIQMFLLLVC